MRPTCPKNDLHVVSGFSSLQRMWCHDCKKRYKWLLKDKQPPLITTNRDTRGKK